MNKEIEAIKTILNQDRTILQEHCDAAGLPFPQILEFSGLTYSVFCVKGRYYLKINGSLTGEKSRKIELWENPRGGRIRKREERIHLKNYPYTPQMERHVKKLIKAWRRCKALMKYLENLDDTDTA